MKILLASVLAAGLLTSAVPASAADVGLSVHIGDHHHGYDRHHWDHDRYRHDGYFRHHRHHERYCTRWAWHHHQRWCRGWGWRWY